MPAGPRIDVPAEEEEEEEEEGQGVKMTVLGQRGALEPEFEVGGGCGWVGLDWIVCLFSCWVRMAAGFGWVGDK